MLIVERSWVWPLAVGALVAGCRGGEGLIQRAEAEGPAMNPPALSEAFWRHWGDGQAELAGYELTIPRYGEQRRGVAISIFVREDFSPSARVKADLDRPDEKRVPVMKLNLVEDFQTGIYDYNVLTSSFVALSSQEGRPAGSATKLSFSAQEWCGHTYHQLLFDSGSIREDLHSYFDGEGDQENTLSYPKDGVSEDFLPLWARGMAAPGLAPGESREVSLLTSLKRARFSHKAVSWNRAVLSRSEAAQTLSVPAGSFEVEVLKASLEGGEQITFYVEAAAPYRIIEWETSWGEEAKLLRSERLPYWELHGEGKEPLLEKLGLSPRPPRTP